MKTLKDLWNRIFLGFLNGIVILLPVLITVMIIRFLVVKLNDAVLTPLLKLLSYSGNEIPHVYVAKSLIFIFVVAGVVVIGWAARILVIKRFFSWGEKIFLKVPIMGRIYNAVKQISSAFLGQGKTIFKQVVLIEYPRKGLHSIGFTTGTTKGEVKDVLGKNGINVFVPTTPNPTSGVFIIVSRDEIQFLDMSVEDGMKLVISGGSVAPLYAGSEGLRGDAKRTTQDT